MKNFVVLHYMKSEGSSSGALGLHILRGRVDECGQWLPNIPANADAGRTHLNRQFINPELTDNLDQRVKHRIDEAMQGRTVKSNQVRSINIILSMSPDAATRIIEEEKLDDWCSSSLEWLNEIHGKENIVSAVLHMDEKTPHIHATLVPIVQGQSKQQKYDEGKRKPGDKPKRKYKKAPEDTLRLCAADVMARTALKSYQSSYAAKMAVYGLERGLDGSNARHVDIDNWYRELVEKVADSESRLAEAEERYHQAMIKLVSLSKENERLESEKRNLEIELASKQATVLSLQTDIETLDSEISGRNERKERLRGAYEGAKDIFTGKARKRAENAEMERDEAKRKAELIISDAESRVAAAENKAAFAEHRRIEAEKEAQKARKETEQVTKKIQGHLRDLIEIDNMRTETKNLKENNQKIETFLEEASSFNLSSLEACQLFKEKKIELPFLKHPETGDIFTRTDRKPISLKMERGHIKAFLTTSWEQAKEWFRGAVNSLWFSVNGIPNNRRQEGNLKY